MTWRQFDSFKVFQEKKVDKKEGLISEIISIWSSYGIKYRNNPKEYEKLVKEKETLGLALNNSKIKKSIKRYPKNIIFEFEGEEELTNFLSTLSEGRLECFLELCQDTIIDEAFRALDAYICDAKYAIYRERKKIEEAEKNRAFQESLKNIYGY
jgi:hypothetical protein